MVSLIKTLATHLHLSVSNQCVLNIFFLKCVPRLPFDWRNPFGYLIAIAIHCILFWYETMIGACPLVSAFGYYYFGIAASKCIKGSLFSIAQSIDAKINKKHIFDQLAEFIELHSSVEQLSSI